MSGPADTAWESAPNLQSWSSPGTSHALMGGPGRVVPRDWMVQCVARVRDLEEHLVDRWVGIESPEVDNPIPWILATLIARENVFLHGAPGVAKSEIATTLFKALGLEQPEVDPHDGMLDLQLKENDPLKWWTSRSREEEKRQKYFHFLLNRFTQPEELFGPIEIDLLRHGILARVNFGLLTGPGVRAVFLDEVFKASSSVLNTLLTLMNERSYFNWGGFQPSDLAMVIGASNEMPGGFAQGIVDLTRGGEDFSVLYAFLDRFATRIDIPAASAGNDPGADILESDLARAFDKAVQREAGAFTGIDPTRVVDSGGSVFASINDILLLGRGLLQPLAGAGGEGLFRRDALERFRRAFLHLAAGLQEEATHPERGRVTWSISPRKLKALYKIALAHALLSDRDFTPGATRVAGPGREQLRVFNLIWDSPTVRAELVRRTRETMEDY